jgi:hypothetical protein
VTSQGWSAPPAPSRWLALLAAAGVLTAITPVLAVVSFYTVAFMVEVLLTREEDVCRTYACGDGAVWVLILFSLGWMCVMWMAGLVTSAIAIRRTVSVGRAVVAALIAALIVTLIAVAADWAWVVLSV